MAGLVVSVANPLGLRLLAFPLTLGQKKAAFKNIVEWRSPDFSRGGGYFALAFLALALVLLFRARLSWRDIVPVVGFLAAALLAARNIGPLAVVLAPTLGRALRRTDQGPDTSTRSAGNPRMNRAVLATLTAACVLFTALIFTSDPIDTVGYPVKPVTWLEQQGLLTPAHHLAHEDFVGNYLTLRYGTGVKVFVDDRFDMYPLSVSADYDTLLAARAGTMDVIDARHIDVVLWERKLPLVQNPDGAAAGGRRSATRTTSSCSPDPQKQKERTEVRSFWDFDLRGEEEGRGPATARRRCCRTSSWPCRPGWSGPRCTPRR